METEINPLEKIQAENDRNDLLAKIRKKVTDYPAAWAETYKECKTSEDFVLLGKQLSPYELRKYGFPLNSRQPNLLKTYVNNQANKTLSTHYHPVISPNGGGSDITKARMREDVVRGIDRNGGPQARNNARRGQLSAGLHYTRVVVDYAAKRGNQKSFRQEDVVDTYNVFPDPTVQTGSSCTFSGMKDFLIREDVPKGLWKDRTGEDWPYGNERTHTLWYYWERATVSTEKEFYRADGSGVLESEAGDNFQGLQMEKDGVTPFSRDVSEYEWNWCVYDDKNQSIKREGNWLGDSPPLVACTGERVIESTDNGLKVHFFPLTKDAEEPQINYTLVSLLIKLRQGRSPYSKWKIPFESIIGKQAEDLRKSSIAGDFDIIYKSLDDSGKALPNSPEEIQPYILDKVLLELLQMYENRIKRILGIFDDAIGRQTQAKSGVAVERLTQQSDLSSYHFEFNFEEYVKQIGYVELEAFPKYLTGPQQIAFVDRDDKAVMQLINAPGAPSFDPNEKYSLVVEASPDGETDREAERDSLMQMMENPYMGAAIAKTPGGIAVVIKAQRGRYAQQLGEMLEQQAQDPEKQQMGQQLQQAGKIIGGLKQQLTASNLALKGKTDQASLDMVKENNRHLEAITRLRLDAEVEPFNANTERLKVVAVPQQTNELPVEEMA